MPCSCCSCINSASRLCDETRESCYCLPDADALMEPEEEFEPEIEAEVVNEVS